MAEFRIDGGPYFDAHKEIADLFCRYGHRLPRVLTDRLRPLASGGFLACAEFEWKDGFCTIVPNDRMLCILADLRGCERRA